MIKLYEDLNEQEQSELAKAWAGIAKGLQVYGAITGANDLDDVIYEHLWQEIGFQKDDEE